MENPLATGLALVAVVLAVAALFAMSAGNIQVAGFLFLSVSVVVYLRETRVVSD